MHQVPISIVFIFIFIYSFKRSWRIENDVQRNANMLHEKDKNCKTDIKPFQGWVAVCHEKGIGVALFCRLRARRV